MSKRPLVIDSGVVKELPVGVPLTVEPAVASTDALSLGQADTLYAKNSGRTFDGGAAATVFAPTDTVIDGGSA